MVCGAGGAFRRSGSVVNRVPVDRALIDFLQRFLRDGVPYGPSSVEFRYGKYRRKFFSTVRRIAGIKLSYSGLAQAQDG